MAEYDEKNKEQYDKNTDKIWSALDAIRKDKKLKTTKAQVAALAGLHRNTLVPKGSRDWVGVELEIIKSQRQEDLMRFTVSKKQQEENLHSLLDQSKLEILHWFTHYSESERDLEKLRNSLKRHKDSLEWYKVELAKARQSQKELVDKIELLEHLLNDKSVNNGA